MSLVQLPTNLEVKAVVAKGVCLHLHLVEEFVISYMVLIVVEMLNAKFHGHSILHKEELVKQANTRS